MTLITYCANYYIHRYVPYYFIQCRTFIKHFLTNFNRMCDLLILRVFDQQCNNTNSITHLIALCNHIKPLWQELETICNELTAIISDECKYPIKEEYFYFGPPTMPSRRQILEKVQFQILDILIRKLQLVVFTNYNLTSRNSNSANPQYNSTTVKQIWHLNMSRSTNAIINSSNKQRSINVWTFRSNKILPSTTIKTWIPSFYALTNDTILSLSH